MPSENGLTGNLLNFPTGDNNNSVNNAPRKNDILVINVSGKRFETYAGTLGRFPKTLLGDNQRRDKYYNKDKKEYFFDRNRKVFASILYYYQSNGILESPQGVSQKAYSEELVFFDLAEATYNVGDVLSPTVLPTSPILRKIWILLEQQNSSLTAKIIALTSVLITMLSIVFFCLETLPDLNPEEPEGAHMKNTWFVLNTICNVWFTLEFVLRLVASPQKKLFVTSALNIVDLLSVLPYYLTLILNDASGSSYIVVLRVLRIVRVVRIFKLTRHSRGLHVLANTVRASFRELMMLAMFLSIGVIMFSSAVYFAESRQHPHKATDFKSIPHAFWWAVVTMTTVGYGDIAPTTLIGKLVGTLCAISGVLVIALPVPVIVSNFEHFYKEEQAYSKMQEELAKQQRGQQTRLQRTFSLITDKLREHKKNEEQMPFTNSKLNL